MQKYKLKKEAGTINVIIDGEVTQVVGFYPYGTNCEPLTDLNINNIIHESEKATILKGDVFMEHEKFKSLIEILTEVKTKK